MSNEEENPKIIVDEDWKSQVEAERETEETTGEELPEMEMPEPSLELMISTMATQAVMALGLAPDPMTGKSGLDLKLAKFHIDMLDMIDEKTANNRTPEEDKMLGESLHELRMLFVTVSKSPEQFGSQDATDEDSGNDDSGPSIVTP